MQSDDMSSASSAFLGGSVSGIVNGGGSNTPSSPLFRAPIAPTPFDMEEEDQRRAGSIHRPGSALSASASASASATSQTLAKASRATGTAAAAGTAGSHKPYGFTYYLLRWPFLGVVCVIIFVELAFYTLLRWIIAVSEVRKYMLLRKLRAAKTYDEYKAHAVAIDNMHGKDNWVSLDESPFYDAQLISGVTASLRQAQASGKVAELQQVLMTACRNNLGGIENEQLYSHTYFGTKRLVDNYVETVVKAVDAVSNNSAIDNRGELFRKLTKTYGRTALCLSGGASFGYYHLGVVKALLEADALPTVISGTSAGALMGAFVCCRTDDELRQVLNPTLHERFKANDEGMLRVLLRLMSEGVMFDLGRWEIKMKANITFGNTTFLEAYQRTGRVFNICVASEEKFSPPFFLNYKTTPDVVIWSAVLASSSVPGILHPVELKIKRPDGSIEAYKSVGRRWRDGVLRADVPLTALHQLFGVNYSIVSQVNPHVIPFYFENRGSGGAPTLHWKGHGWRGGFFASAVEDFLKLDMKKWMQLLQDLNLLPRVLGQDWSFAFLQQFNGTVTIVPPFNIVDYAQIIFDPNQHHMGRYILSGQRASWPKLCMIRNRLAIEKALAAASAANRVTKSVTAS